MQGQSVAESVPCFSFHAALSHARDASGILLTLQPLNGIWDLSRTVLGTWPDLAFVGRVGSPLTEHPYREAASWTLDDAYTIHNGSSAIAAAD